MRSGEYETMGDETLTAKKVKLQKRHCLVSLSGYMFAAMCVRMCAGVFECLG